MLCSQSSKCHRTDKVSNDDSNKVQTDEEESLELLTGGNVLQQSQHQVINSPQNVHAAHTHQGSPWKSTSKLYQMTSFEWLEIEFSVRISTKPWSIRFACQKQSSLADEWEINEKWPSCYQSCAKCYLKCKNPKKMKQQIHSFQLYGTLAISR